MGWIDAHCHLYDIADANNLEQEMRKAREAGLGLFISSALSDAEVKWHLENKASDVLITAGIHPNNSRSLPLSYDELVKLCDKKQIIAVGEIGLDKRNDDFETQKKVLLLQLDIAQQYNLPVVFHVVKHYYELSKILKRNFPKIRGYIHSFTGSIDIAKLFANYDLAYSFCGRTPNAEVLKFCLENGNCLFETDAPYQKPLFLNRKHNYLDNYPEIIGYVSQLTGISQAQLKKIQKKTFEYIFPSL
jgi:TatD DNase family protein